MLYQNQTDMKATFDNLRKLEAQINKAYYSSKNFSSFIYTQKGQKLEARWNAMMIQLRGWDVISYDENGNSLTKSSWIEYCKKENIYPSYNIGDVCA